MSQKRIVTRASEDELDPIECIKTLKCAQDGAQLIVGRDYSSEFLDSWWLEFQTPINEDSLTLPKTAELTELASN